MPQVANFILKKNQLLLQISTKDLAFIAEHHLSAVYHLFAKKGIVVNLMRNTATKAMFCINHDTIIVPKVLSELKEEFELEWTDSVELLTIRHYSASDEARETEGLEILLEQRTPETVQFVFKSCIFQTAKAHSILANAKPRQTNPIFSETLFGPTCNMRAQRTLSLSSRRFTSFGILPSNKLVKLVFSYSNTSKVLLALSWINSCPNPKLG